MALHIRVLAAEDDPAARALLEGLLPRLEGIELCGVAGDGYEALELVRRERPDAVLLDLVMPGLDGLGFLRLLRGEKPRPAVVVTSQVSDPRVVRHALALGADYYLVKPLRFDGLPALLQALCLAPLERAGEEYLRQLGAAGLGVEAAARTAAVLAQGPDIPLKEGYAAAMAAQDTSYACVEKNIRSMVDKLHAAGGAGYHALMGGPPPRRPGNEAFLRALAKRLKE